MRLRCFQNLVTHVILVLWSYEPSRQSCETENVEDGLRRWQNVSHSWMREPNRLCWCCKGSFKPQSMWRRTSTLPTGCILGRCGWRAALCVVHAPALYLGNTLQILWTLPLSPLKIKQKLKNNNMIWHLFICKLEKVDRWVRWILFAWTFYEINSGKKSLTVWSHYSTLPFSDQITRSGWRWTSLLSGVKAGMSWYSLLPPIACHFHLIEALFKVN